MRVCARVYFFTVVSLEVNLPKSGMGMFGANL